jgi:3-oxoacyl-[acyl-carrier protein] reductase
VTAGAVPVRNAKRVAASALITGASGGIGRAVARRLAAEGYNLTLSGRHHGTLSEVARELSDTGVEVEVTPADMAVEDEIRGLARAHADRFGALDILVLCAGVGTSGLMADYPMHRFDRQIAVNLRAPFVLIQECLPLLRTAGAANPGRGARVMAVASITGVSAEPGLAAYAAAKAALISLCQSVNVEESPRGISATAISPGYVDTAMSTWVHDQLDPRQMIEPADIADLVAAFAGLSAQAVVPHAVVTRRGAAQLRA